MQFDKQSILERIIKDIPVLGCKRRATDNGFDYSTYRSGPNPNFKYDPQVNPEVPSLNSSIAEIYTGRELESGSIAAVTDDPNFPFTYTGRVFVDHFNEIIREIKIPFFHHLAYNRLGFKKTFDINGQLSEEPICFSLPWRAFPLNDPILNEVFDCFQTAYDFVSKVENYHDLKNKPKFR